MIPENKKAGGKAEKREEGGVGSQGLDMEKRKGNSESYITKIDILPNVSNRRLM